MCGKDENLLGICRNRAKWPIPTKVTVKMCGKAWDILDRQTNRHTNVINKRLFIKKILFLCLGAVVQL
jgi:hypothetical protein